MHQRCGRPLYRVLQIHLPYHSDLRGLKLVIDTANGAGYGVAPKVFHELGAQVVSIGNEPNGYNINEKCI